MQETKRIFITVKTYPNPSARHSETVCVAGIGDVGNWLRLYPVPFRQLRTEQQFRKYDWIEASVSRATKDPRPESFHIDDRDSIRVVQRQDKAAWAVRRDLVLRALSPSVEQLERDRKQTGRSLGVIRPAVNDFTCERDEPANWTPEEERKLDQEFGSLFDELASPRPQRLQKVPYIFRYHFRDDEPNCKGHAPAVRDWEAYQYARRLPLGDPERVAAGMKAQFFDYLARQRDLHFIMGTMVAHPHNWIVVGLFYPPTDEQLRLDFGE